MNTLRVSFLLLFTFFWVSALHAQTTSESRESDLLPDINPQDIEIKGDYRIRFPGLQRQPILGFDPRPRVYLLNPNRIPFLETSDEIVTSIPISPLEMPLSPVRSYPPQKEPANWWLLGGYGLQNNPEAELGFQSIKPGEYRFSSFISHLSSSDLNFGYPSEFKQNKGMVSFTKVFEPGFTWNTRVEGGLFSNYAPDSDTTFHKQNVKRWALETHVSSRTNAWKFSDFGLAYHGFMQERTDAINSEFYHTLAINAENNWMLSEPMTGMRLGTDGQMGFYDISGAGETNAIAHIFWQYRNFSSYGKKITLGLDPYLSKDAVTRFLIYPTLKFEYSAWAKSVLRAELSGEVSNDGRWGFFETSRFINTSQRPLNNRGWVMSLQFEKELMAGSTIYAGFDAKRYTQFSYIHYGLNTNPLFATEMAHNIKYSEAQIVKLKGGYSYRFDAPGLSFNVESWILNHQLKGGKQIPYMERFGVKSDILWFIQNNWYIQPGIIFLSGRKGAQTSNSIVLVDFATRYAFNKNWALFLKVNNVLNTNYTYWSDYRENPLFLTGGLNLIF